MYVKLAEMGKPISGTIFPNALPNLFFVSFIPIHLADCFTILYKVVLVNAFRGMRIATSFANISSNFFAPWEALSDPIAIPTKRVIILFHHQSHYYYVNRALRRDIEVFGLVLLHGKGIAPYLQELQPSYQNLLVCQQHQKL